MNTNTNQKTKKNWAETFFNKMYLELFMKRSPAEIAIEVQIIKQLIDENKITRLLDVCCGIGDIARSLENELDAIATGIELSSYYVTQSHIKDIIKGDACEPQTNRTFPLVLNWFSSFSYFEPEKNKKLLTNCYNYCEDVFLLEFYNPYAVMLNFKEQIQYKKEYLGKNYFIDRNSHINVNNRTLCQEWIFNTNNQQQIYNTDSYLYFPDEVKHLLLTIGFNNVQIMGRNENKITSFNVNSPRIIIKATK